MHRTEAYLLVVPYVITCFTTIQAMAGAVNFRITKSEELGIRRTLGSYRCALIWFMPAPSAEKPTIVQMKSIAKLTVKQEYNHEHYSACI
jgi:hypothetical protein